MFKRILVLFVLIVLSLPLTAFSPLMSAGDHNLQTANSVTILVVDTFSEEDADTTMPEDGTCVVSAEEQGFVIRGFSDEDTIDPHGSIVVDEIEETLADLGADPADFNIVEVELKQDAGEMAAEIQSAIDDASDSDFIVINMSFGLVPCEFLEAMEAFGGEFLDAREAGDLNRYRGIFQRAVVFYDNQVFPAAAEAFQDADDLHPLQSVLANHKSNVVAVAAAGNFGLDMPFWPAAWGQVVSVSASSGEGLDAPMAWVDRGADKDMPLLSVAGEGNNTDRISNYGEVMIPGEFAVGDGFVEGTSFAAPRLTALVAVYLANDNSFCTNDDGYFGLITSENDNQTLADAISGGCAELGAYLP